MNPQVPGAPAPQPPVDNNAAMANVINNLPPAPAPTGLDINFNSDPNDLGTGFLDVPVPPAPIPQAPAPPANIQPQPPVAQPVVAPPAPAPAPQPPIDPNLIPLTIPTPPEPIPQPVPAIQQPPIAPAPPVTPPAPAEPPKFDPQNWDDVQNFIVQEAQRIADERVNAVITQQQTQAEAEAEALRQADHAIDTALAQLEQTGYIPPVANPTDPNDPGKLARLELYGYAISLGTDNLTAVAPNLYALHQSGYYFDTQKNSLVRKGSQTAAAQAPISGATPSITATNAPTVTMTDFRTKDLRSIADMASNAIPLS